MSFARTRIDTEYFATASEYSRIAKLQAWKGKKKTIKKYKNNKNVTLRGELIIG
jgi:hypothetical protein